MDSMASTSTSKSASKTTNEYESTLRPLRSKVSKVCDKKLRYRRIWLKATPDNQHAHFLSILKTEFPERRLRESENLQDLMRDFLRQAMDSPDESCYPYIDDFSYNFDHGKSKLNFPVVNEKYFQADLQRCLAQNEAILQRTIMIHIIDQYWLGETFDFNCEGQWSQPKDSLLPSTKNDGISLPKPDLAISFKLQAFTEEEADSDPIPDHLEKTISPDGDERCFPFLFIEVKKARAEVEEAYRTNLHTASQALYNMYTWMSCTKEHLQAFFGTVRVFSLVLNAQDLSVRIHRAFQPEDQDLTYRYEEFRPLSRYSRNQACQLVKTIVNDYAAKELHSVLKSAFVEVTKQEKQLVRSKRKAEPSRSGSSKKLRKDQDAGDQDTQSFGMSNLSTKP